MDDDITTSNKNKKTRPSRKANNLTRQLQNETMKENVPSIFDSNLSSKQIPRTQNKSRTNQTEESEELNAITNSDTDDDNSSKKHAKPQNNQNQKTLQTYKRKQKFELEEDVKTHAHENKNDNANDPDNSETDDDCSDYNEKNQKTFENKNCQNNSKTNDSDKLKGSNIQNGDCDTKTKKKQRSRRGVPKNILNNPTFVSNNKHENDSVKCLNQEEEEKKSNGHVNDHDENADTFKLRRSCRVAKKNAENKNELTNINETINHTSESNEQKKAEENSKRKFSEIESIDSNDKNQKKRRRLNNKTKPINENAVDEENKNGVDNQTDAAIAELSSNKKGKKITKRNAKKSSGRRTIVEDLIPTDESDCKDEENHDNIDEHNNEHVGNDVNTNHKNSKRKNNEHTIQEKPKEIKSEKKEENNENLFEQHASHNNKKLTKESQERLWTKNQAKKDQQRRAQLRNKQYKNALAISLGDTNKKKQFPYDFAAIKEQIAVLNHYDSQNGYKVADRPIERYNVVVVGSAQRTLKILFAIARGGYIVEYDWITQSLKEELWKSPQDYICKYECAKKAENSRTKQQNTKQKVLQKCKICIVKREQQGSKIKPTTQEIAELALCSGATVYIDDGFEEGNVCISDEKLHRQNSRILKENSHIQLVNAQWLIETVWNYEQQPFDDYLIYNNNRKHRNKRPTKNNNVVHDEDSYDNENDEDEKDE